jgi:arginyl-tRNA synthetase
MPYVLDDARRQIRELLESAAGSSNFEIKEAPPKVDADLSVPLFALAKERGVNPAQLAGELAAAVPLAGTLFSALSVTGGFLNFQLDATGFVRRLFEDFARTGDGYGGSDEGAGQTIVIDYSSPNIAKPFSVGHLRSTVIGQAIYNLFVFRGYQVVGDNHIGDWGTQFGKLLVAYDRWADPAAVAASPIRELLALYVRYHEEAEADPSLDEAARGWFQRLEEGDPEARRLWQSFRDLSWKDFERVYRLLGVEFDEVLGESFYNDRLEGVVEQAFASGVAEWGEIEARAAATEEAAGDGEDDGEDGGEDGGDAAAAGAEPATEPAMEKVALIRLDDYGIETPLLIQKSDGTSLYATRDLATLAYRQERWHPEQILYVVGGEQQLYFRQLFQAAERLGIDARCVHVWFGLIRLPGGKMSTRKGRVIFLEEVLDEAVTRARAVLEERELTDAEKDEIARVVGIGAVKYADLSQTRTRDVLFDWDKMLNLQGDSAPYLQYAAVRVRSIVRKADAATLAATPDPDLLTEPAERSLVHALAEFPQVVEAACATYFPHLVASYLVRLAREFSTFYSQVQVLQADLPLAATRLALCRKTAQVLVRGLALLGIEAPERM